MPSVLPLMVGVVPPFLLVVTPFNGDTKNIQLGVRMASMTHQNQSAHFPTSRATRCNLNEMVTTALYCGVRMSYCKCTNIVNMERKTTKYQLNFGLQFLHIQPPTRCFWRYSNWHVFPSPLPAKLSFSSCELKALREARDMIPSAACNRVARVGRFAKLIFVSHVASLGSKACNSFTSLPCLATLARKSSPKLRRATTAFRS